MKAIEITPCSRGWFGIQLTSGCDEYPGCKLIVWLRGRWITLHLPRIIRPARSWQDMSDMAGKPGYEWMTPKPDGRYGYYNIYPRQYSVSYLEGAVHVRYGQQTMDSETEKSWCKHVPWLDWRFVRHSLYDLAGNRVADVPEGKYTQEHWAQREALLSAQPKAYYLFRDYDGEEIRARCSIEEMEWRRGTGWFRWLSLLSPARKCRTLRLDFSSEVGPEKGSWKGGTVGHSIEMQPGEAIEAAFLRYCAEHKLTFLGASEEWAQPVPAEQPSTV